MIDLLEIRCPFKIKSKKDGKLYNCNRICVKVTSGSSGEAMCRSCHLTFNFKTDNNEIKRTVKIKEINGHIN